MFEDILKIFRKLGANGIIILILWAILALSQVADELPAAKGSTLMQFKTIIQYALATAGTITAAMFITWNVFGRPKRLGFIESD